MAKKRGANIIDAGTAEIIIEAAVAAIYIFLCFRTLGNQLAGTGASQGLFLGLMLAAIMLWAVLSFMVHRLCGRGFGIVRIFLTLYFSLGALYLLAIPLYGVPDELAHFERIYGITEGYLIAEVSEDGAGGSPLPENIIEGNHDAETTLSDVVRGFSILASEKKTFMEYGNTAYYSPLTYTPQIIGVALARLFTDRLYIAAYAGRVCGFIAVGLLLARTIKLLPFGKEIVLAIGFFPITLQEAVSLSGDAFTFAIAAYFTAFCLHSMCDSGGLSGGELAEGFVLLLFLGSCKFIYAPLALMLLFVPADRFGGVKKKWLLGIAAAVLLAVVCLGWFAITQRYLGFEFRPGVDMDAQTEVILSRPLNFLGIYAATAAENFSYYTTGMVASHLGIYRVEPPIWISRLGLFILLLTAFVSWERVGERSGKKGGDGGAMEHIGLWQIIGVLLTAAIVMLLIGVSLYLQWTPVGAPRIEGIQGRYFLPVLPAVVLMLRRIFYAIPARLSADREIVCRVGVFIALVAWCSLIGYYIV